MIEESAWRGSAGGDWQQVLLESIWKGNVGVSSRRPGLLKRVKDQMEKSADFIEKKAQSPA